ncbi:uncharacterized protein [Ptychodera flava]|uniref:uncharacterized protein isoform X2 n=1 Tax=Ptychodera flava TaxID=63121 RepID=UPI00396A3386
MEKFTIRKIIFSVLCFVVDLHAVALQGLIGQTDVNGNLRIGDDLEKRECEVEIPENERFRVNETNGDIILAGYLDFNIDQTYQMEITAKSVKAVNVSHDMDNTSYTLVVIVVDVAKWPPVYNETCETEPREQSDWPAFLRIYLEKEKIAADKLNYKNPGEPPLSFIEADTDNNKCRMRLFFEFRDKDLLLENLDISYHCSNPNFPHLKFFYYYDKESFPSDAIISPYWFLRSSPENHFSLGEVRVDSMATATPSIVSNCSFGFQDQQIHVKEIDLRMLGCPSGTYGFKCDKKCICQNGASCHVFNGACKCPTGWYGPACDIPRPSIIVSPKISFASYGGFVTLFCEINNIKTINVPVVSWYFNDQQIYDEGSDSYVISDENRLIGFSSLDIKHMDDRLAGVYTCQAQDIDGKIYTDSSILNVECNDGTYGPTCESFCDCQAKTSTLCDRYRGCICKHGWNGTRCQIDYIKPSIQSCPSDITQYVDRGTDYATVIWIEPESFDNSDHLNFTSSHRPKDTFGIGTTLVTYTAVDGSNNMATCMFYVHVIVKPIDGRKVGGAAMLAFVALIPVFIYIGYKYRLKIYLAFSLPVEQYDDDNEKECDAFVTYSSRDEDFVDDVLTDLERDDRYRLFLHQRDFKGGQSIFRNIEEALDKSRCTILVLSPAFIQSRWCQFETMAAMRKLVDNGQRLIPIMKEDVLHLELTPLMKRILDSVTCIKWKQNGTEKQKNKFWDELESAVRKRRRLAGQRGMHRILVAMHRRISNCVALRYEKLNDDDDIV